MLIHKLNKLRADDKDSIIGLLEAELDSKLLEIALSEDGGHKLSPEDGLSAVFETIYDYRLAYPSEHSDPEILSMLSTVINRSGSTNP